VDAIIVCLMAKLAVIRLRMLGLPVQKVRRNVHLAGASLS